MGLRRQILVVMAGVLVMGVAPQRPAEMPEKLAVSVVHANRVVARVGEEETARVLPMARGENAYMGELSLVARAEVGPVVREAEEYLYILQGSALLEVDGKSYLVGPRMGVFIPAGSEVKWTNGPDRLVAVQAFAGPGPAAAYERWKVEDSTGDAPQYRRVRPRPGRLTLR